jgi:hypothetical protein
MASLKDNFAVAAANCGVTRALFMAGHAIYQDKSRRR